MTSARGDAIDVQQSEEVIPARPCWDETIGVRSGGSLRLHRMTALQGDPFQLTRTQLSGVSRSQDPVPEGDLRLQGRLGGSECLRRGGAEDNDTGDFFDAAAPFARPVRSLARMASARARFPTSTVDQVRISGRGAFMEIWRPGDEPNLSASRWGCTNEEQPQARPYRSLGHQLLLPGYAFHEHGWDRARGTCEGALSFFARTTILA